MESSTFKKCSGCGHKWASRESFMADPDIELKGYQVHFEELKEGLFFFNHSCGTTIAIQVELFQDLYNGPIFKEHLNGTEECSEYCIHKEELRPCPAKCECSSVREIIQIIKSY